MATTINADTSNGLKLTSDTSGVIEFQSAGTTKAGVNSTGLTGNGSQLTALTSGNLTGALPAISGAALTGISSGGVSLLGTLTTTSGTTQSFAVDHTAYNQLIFVFEQVELTGTSGIIQVGVAGLARMNINDVNSTSTTCIIGPVYFDLNANVYWEENQVAAAVIASGNQFHGGSFQGMGQYQVDQNLRASASANVSFSYSSGASFDGGKIYIYGVK